MKRFFALLFCLAILLQSCDDGDIIITTFNFDNADLKVCGTLGNYVFYNVNTDAQESLSLKLGATDSLFRNETPIPIILNGTNHFVNYRTYDGALGNNYFCSSIPPTTPNITVDYFAVAGTAEFTTSFVFDDNDGISIDDEFDGDTDGDGLPNIYDYDDDGDNVPTALELGTLDEPQDSDSDGIPDYLDPDDDGDGVLTRDEDKDGDLNPRNDNTDPNVGADYLNPAVFIDYDINEYRDHTYKITKNVKIVLKNLVLVRGDEEITQETLNMGTINGVETIDKTKKPEF